MNRTKRQKTEHQGKITEEDLRLVKSMAKYHNTHFTTADVCRITGCVSARDKIRKLQAAGIKIGPAKLLRVNDNGSRVFGWRIQK